MEAVGERQIVPPVVAGRQRFVGDEQVMQPARAGEADVVGGVEHGRRIAQELARPLDGDRLQERLRRQPGPALEDVLEVRGGEADMPGDRLDRRLLAIAGRDELDRALDRRVIRACARGIGNVEHGLVLESSRAARRCSRRRDTHTRLCRGRPPENDGRRGESVPLPDLNAWGGVEGLAARHFRARHSPDCFTPLFVPDPPCFSLLSRFFSLFPRGRWLRKSAEN